METKTNLLVCSAGMYTDLLVTRMKKAAAADGIDVDVFDTAAADAEQQLATEPVSVHLLGPTVRFMESQFKAQADEKKILMAVIDMKAVGMMDGEKVLRQALGSLDTKV